MASTTAALAHQSRPNRLSLWLYLTSLAIVPLFVGLNMLFSEAIFRYQISSLGGISPANVGLASLQIQAFYTLFALMASGIVAGLSARMFALHNKAFKPAVTTNFTAIAAGLGGAFSLVSSYIWYLPHLSRNVYTEGVANWLLFLAVGGILPLAYHLALKTLHRRPHQD